jgi:hypothetical protein
MIDDEKYQQGGVAPEEIGMEKVLSEYNIILIYTERRGQAYG